MAGGIDTQQSLARPKSADLNSPHDDSVTMSSSSGEFNANNQPVKVDWAKTPFGHMQIRPTVVIDPPQQQLPPLESLADRPVEKNEYSKIEWPINRWEISGVPVGSLRFVKQGADVGVQAGYAVGNWPGALFGGIVGAVVGGFMAGAVGLCDGIRAGIHNFSKLFGPSNIRRMADQAVMKQIAPSTLDEHDKDDRATFMIYRDALESAARDWMKSQKSTPSADQVEKYINHCAEQLNKEIAWLEVAGRSSDRSAMVHVLKTYAIEDPQKALKRMAGIVVGRCLRPPDCQPRTTAADPRNFTGSDQQTSQALEQALFNVTTNWAKDLFAPPTRTEKRRYMEQSAKRITEQAKKAYFQSSANGSRSHAPARKTIQHTSKVAGTITKRDIWTRLKDDSFKSDTEARFISKMEEFAVGSDARRTTSGQIFERR